MAVYRFKISFEDYEDVYREIEVTSDQTFAQFYTVILSSIGFEDHGVASFYMSNDSWKKGTEITNKEGKLKDGKPVNLMAKALLKNYIADPHQKIYFVIESESVWAFHVELIKILPTSDSHQSYPFVKKMIGDAPKQFKVIIPPVVTEEDGLLMDEDLSDDNETSDNFTGEEEYDEDDAASLEGEEGEDDETNEDMDDVEMSGDENYEEEN